MSFSIPVWTFRQWHLVYVWPFWSRLMLWKAGANLNLSSEGLMNNKWWDFSCYLDLFFPFYGEFTFYLDRLSAPPFLGSTWGSVFFLRSLELPLLMELRDLLRLKDPGMLDLIVWPSFLALLAKRSSQLPFTLPLSSPPFKAVRCLVCPGEEVFTAILLPLACLTPARLLIDSLFHVSCVTCSIQSRKLFLSL